jgi:hypothetical protein
MFCLNISESTSHLVQAALGEGKSCVFKDSGSHPVVRIEFSNFYWWRYEPSNMTNVQYSKTDI